MRFHFRNEWRAPAVAGAISFAAGVGVGYFAFLKKSSADMESVKKLHDEKLALEFALATEQKERRASVKNMTARLQEITEQRRAVEEEEVPAPAPITRPYIAAIPEDGEKIPEEPEEKSEAWNAFNDWDQEAEEIGRSPDAPYVIHVQEFYDESNNHNKMTLSYYEGDNILCDENEVPIYDASKTVGRLEWGRGSNDPNIVYIRNEKMKADFEVLRNTSHYQIEVLGLDIEEQESKNDLKHSKAIPKFKME